MAKHIKESIKFLRKKVEHKLKKHFFGQKESLFK